MERPSTARLSGDMDSMGEAVSDDPHICHPRERASLGWLDTSPAWCAVGLPSVPVTFHSGGGRVGDMYRTIVPQGSLTKRFRASLKHKNVSQTELTKIRYKIK